MKSLQERIEWYEANFPDMAEQGLIRFHDLSTPLSDTSLSQYFQQTGENQLSNFVFTPLAKSRCFQTDDALYKDDFIFGNNSDDEAKWRTYFQMPLVSDIYLTGKSVFLAPFRSQYSTLYSDPIFGEIENDFIFFHELGHKLHSIKHSEIIDGQWIDKSNQNKYVDIVDIDQRILYTECVADTFASLMTIREHGFYDGVDFVNLVSDYRMLNLFNDPTHMTSLTLDSVRDEVNGNGVHLGQSGFPALTDLKLSTPQEILAMSEKIAEGNPIFKVLRKRRGSLESEVEHIKRLIEENPKPITDGNLTLSQYLKDRFSRTHARRFPKKFGQNDVRKP